MKKIKIKLTAPGGAPVSYVSYPINVETGERYVANNGNEAQASVFVLEKYDGDIEDAFYLKLLNETVYLDQKTTSGLVFMNKPVISTDLSTIWAWKVTGQYMGAVAKADPKGLQRISLPNSDRQRSDYPAATLFCNFTTSDAFMVEWVEVK